MKEVVVWLEVKVILVVMVGKVWVMGAEEEGEGLESRG